MRSSGITRVTNWRGWTASAVSISSRPTGQKATGTTSLNPSDARIKTITGGYTAGLAEVLQLNPVTFTFKDNYTREAGAASPHATLAKDRTPCVVLIAQEVEAIFPEMLTKSEAYLDGRKVKRLPQSRHVQFSAGASELRQGAEGGDRGSEGEE